VILIYLLSPTPSRTNLVLDKSSISNPSKLETNVFVSSSNLQLSEQDKGFKIQTPTPASLEFSEESLAASPITKPYDPSYVSGSVKTITEDSDRRTRKDHNQRGYTESTDINHPIQDVSTSSSLDATTQPLPFEPSISSEASIPSTSPVVDTPPECLQTDERGRPLCNKTHHSIYERWSEVSDEAWKIWRLGWWSWIGWLIPGASNIGAGWKGRFVTIGALGMLIFVELVALGVEDEIIKVRRRSTALALILTFVYFV
jgi:hypothetical protein